MTFEVENTAIDNFSVCSHPQKNSHKSVLADYIFPIRTPNTEYIRMIFLTQCCRDPKYCMIGAKKQDALPCLTGALFTQFSA